MGMGMGMGMGMRMRMRMRMPNVPMTLLLQAHQTPRTTQPTSHQAKEEPFPAARFWLIL